MPSLTLKDIPEDLHRKLKEEAEAHGRSLTKEVYVRLRLSIAQGRKSDGTGHILKARGLEKRMKGVHIDGAFLAAARREGRP
jgi:plasmid stability protein